MAKYNYQGVNAAGETVKGSIQAPTEDQARVMLRRQKIRIDNLSKAVEISGNIAIPGLTDRVSLKDLVVMTRTFSVMIDAGIPLVQCFEILGDQSENPALRNAVKQVQSDVEQGSTIANAFRKHPRVFDDLYCNMVEAGEAGGILDTVLNRLSEYMEKAMALRRKVTGAMVYPTVIVVFASVAVAAIMIFVIPTFQEVFKQLGTTLPLPTQIVIAISNFLRGYILFILIGVGVLYAGYTMFERSPNGGRVVDRIKLRLPVFGILLRKVAVAKFTRTLGTLLGSGVPILDGLEITARTAGNRIVEDAIQKTRVSISEGKTISEPLSQTEVFPAMVVQMIAVGEASGALDQMLAKIADFYDDEVDQAVENLTQMIEPAMIMFLGITVGSIVIAMYLPLFKAIEKLS